MWTDHAQALSGLLGAANVSQDDDERAYYSSDVVAWPQAQPPLVAVRPGSTADVAAIVRYAREHDLALVPRGAGLSYTGGVVAGDRPALVVDLTRIAYVHIDAEDQVARVGAGLSWAALATSLSGTGLRPVQKGPISGEHSTIGGAVSQNMPGNLEGVLGLEVVLADASIVRVGAGAGVDSPAFYRHFGPDLTGLFCGDCGSLGIKTEIILRLVPERAASFVSFSFATPQALVGAMSALGKANLGLRLFGMDPQKNTETTKVESKTALQVVGAVLRKGGNPLARIADLVQLARAGGTMQGVGWTLHATAEAATQIAAESLIDEARRLLQGAAVEIDNVLPKTLHAKPYSVRGFVGRQGERWVPIHGILAPSRADAAIAAITDYFAANAERLRQADIAVGYVFSGAGPYVCMEPMFYWPDALGPIHLRYLSERNRQRFADRPDNFEARAIVQEMRAEVRSIFRTFGALHAQLARYYDYAEAMEPATGRLAVVLKQQLDPTGLMNPGALGL